jgi:hypothetical protein
MAAQSPETAPEAISASQHAPAASFAIVGDVHGHLQLALYALARWQRESAAAGWA